MRYFDYMRYILHMHDVMNTLVLEGDVRTAV
jgi:hypothetical protein